MDESLFEIIEIEKKDKEVISKVVDIHIRTFKGFFLTFLGKGFLKVLYSGYCSHKDSGLIVAKKQNQVVGFLAYSHNLSGFYKYLIKKKFFSFAWYSLGAFLRKPTVFLRLIRAFLKPGETKRKEKYVELSSIGVDPNYKSRGVGSMLIDELKSKVNFNEYGYVTLETDALNNEGANHFYQKNKFVIEREFETNEGRKMFEYRFRLGENEK